MGTLILLISTSCLLIWWHIELHALAAVSFRLVRRYLGWSVAWKATRLLRLAKTYGGLRVDVDRRQLGTLQPPFILVANHQSLADIVVILAVFKDLPIRFVAKAELRKSFPAVSPVLRFQRHALIDRRGNFRAALAELRRLGRRSRDGLCPVVFPEGTRSRTGEIGSFHSGALKAIHTVTPMPLACVALDGGSRFLSFADIRGGMSGAIYRVRVLATRDVGSPGIQATLQEFHDLIAHQLATWRQRHSTVPQTCPRQ